MDFSRIPALDNWYAKCEQYRLGGNITDEETVALQRDGWVIAKAVRTLLPKTVDLFYGWESTEHQADAYGDEVRFSILVPNVRAIKIDPFIVLDRVPRI